MDTIRVGRKEYRIEYDGPDHEKCWRRFKLDGKPMWMELHPRGQKYQQVRLAAQKAGYFPPDDYRNGRKIYAAEQKVKGPELTYGRVKDGKAYKGNYKVNEEGTYFRRLGVWKKFKENNITGLEIRRSAIKKGLIPDDGTEARLIALGWEMPKPLVVRSMAEIDD